MVAYIIERCEACGATDKRQNVPQVIKHVRQQDGRAVSLACCKDCADKVDLNNKPYEEEERIADEEAKAKMDEKAAALKKEEQDKKDKEGQMLEMLVQQNQMMFASMQQTQQLLAALIQKPADEPTRTRRTRSKRQEVQSSK